MRILTHTVLPEEDGRMVKGILRGSLQLSYTLLKSLKWRENAILLNGQSVHVNAIVRAGTPAGSARKRWASPSRAMGSVMLPRSAGSVPSASARYSRQKSSPCSARRSRSWT